MPVAIDSAISYGTVSRLNDLFDFILLMIFWSECYEEKIEIVEESLHNPFSADLASVIEILKKVEKFCFFLFSL